MSAAKMVADSTADLPEMSGTKKRKKVVQKKKVKKKKEKESSKKMKKKSPEREFDENDLDKKINPIGHYVKDREQLLEEMFHCVKGPSLDRAIPEVLKDVQIEDLKQRCLQQLLVMSKKRIRRILAGDDPSTISSSGTEDETSEEEFQEMETEDNYDNNDEVNIVDSTSINEQDSYDSDRVIDDDNDGSMIHSSISPYPSDDEQTYQNIYEDCNSEENESANESQEIESLGKKRQALTVRDPEDLEEGEVFDDDDDDDDDGPGSNVETTVDVRGSNTDDNDVKDDADGDVKVVTESAETKVEDGPLNVVNIMENVDSKIEHIVIKTETVINETEAIDNETDLKAEDSHNNEISKDNVTSDSCRKDDVGDEKTVMLDKPRDIPEETQGENTDSNVIEIIVGEEDQQFVEEVNEPSENDESDGEVVESGDNDDNNDDDVEAGTSENTASGRTVQPPRRVVRPPSAEIAPALTRNQMELLELEMRARAIKAMLKTAK